MSKREGEERRVAERNDGPFDGEHRAECAGATRGSGALCVIDHANKRRDRDRPNPNRALIVRLRADALLPGRNGAATTRRGDTPPAGKDRLPPEGGEE